MIPHKTKLAFASSLVVAAVALAAACENSGFTAGGSKTARDNGQGDGKPGKPGGKPGQDTDLENAGKDGDDAPGGSDDPGLGTTVPGTDDDESGGGVDAGLTTDDAEVGKPTGTGITITDAGVPCTKRPLPLHIVFAVDSTGSMDDEIDAVRNNVVQFAAKVKDLELEGTKAKIPSIKIGGVSYVDMPGQNEVVALTDPQSFQASAANWDTRGGIHDHCEGGLQAAKVGLDMLAAAAAQEKGGALSVLVVVTDNWSHDGKSGDGSRTFDDTELRDAVGKSALKHLLFFDSSPNDTSSPPRLTGCATAPTSAPPAAQWQKVRDAWRAAHPKVKVDPGKRVAFPFTQTTILQQVTDEVRRLIRICK